MNRTTTLDVLYGSTVVLATASIPLRFTGHTAYSDALLYLMIVLLLVALAYDVRTRDRGADQ